MDNAAENDDRDHEASRGASGVPPTGPSDHLFGTNARADAYSAWAQRLRDKRVRSQERIRDTSPGSDAPVGSTYWSSEALFNESQRVEEEEQETGSFSGVRDLLAVFNLEEGASKQEITLAYRGLAKLHHPDRYEGADADIRDLHAGQMQRINTAYRALRDQYQT